MANLKSTSLAKRSIQSQLRFSHQSPLPRHVRPGPHEFGDGPLPLELAKVSRPHGDAERQHRRGRYEQQLPRRGIHGRRGRNDTITQDSGAHAGTARIRTIDTPCR